MPTLAPIVRCTYQSCGGWIQRDVYSARWECGLCGRTARIQDARIVMLLTDDEAVPDPWPSMRLARGPIKEKAHD